MVPLSRRPFANLAFPRSSRVRALLAILVLGIIPLLVLAVTHMSASGDPVWHYYATFYDEQKASYSNEHCVAVGRMWVTSSEARIVYSGVGAPECFQDTAGAVLELVYHNGRVWTYSHESDQSTDTKSEIPGYLQDLTLLTTGGGPWCDPTYYSCEIVGAEQIAGRSATHVHVQNRGSTSSESLDFWIDSQTGRPLRETSGPIAQPNSDFSVTAFNDQSSLPTGIFDQQPFMH